MSVLPVILMAASATSILSPSKPMPAVGFEQVSGPQAAQPQATSQSESGARGSFVAAAGAGASGYQPLSGKERWNLYVCALCCGAPACFLRRQDRLWVRS